MAIIQSLILAIVLLLLGLFVVKPIITKSLSSQDKNSSPGGSTVEEFSSQIDILDENDEPFEDELPDLPTLNNIGQQMTVVDDFGYEAADDTTSGDSIGELKNVIEERKTDAIEILRGWIEEKSEPRGAS